MPLATQRFKIQMQHSEGHPQVAQVAIQHGINLAANFKALLNNKPLTAFTYNDKGSMAIIGKKSRSRYTKPKCTLKAFCLGNLLFIHLVSLITYRNRVKTFFNWMIAYFSKDNSLRMIIRPDKTRKTEVKQFNINRVSRTNYCILFFNNCNSFFMFFPICKIKKATKVVVVIITTIGIIESFKNTYRKSQSTFPSWLPLIMLKPLHFRKSVKPCEV
jgi:hypothetical protein